MSDLSEKPKPGYAPVYCALYPGLAEIARAHGYALSVHGSMNRDMDLVCIPWADEVSEPQVVVDAICSRYAIKPVHEGFIHKNHGRICMLISIEFGSCAIDLSFMPAIK